MKYKMFRTVLIAAGLGLLGLGAWQCSRCTPDDDKAETPVPSGDQRRAVSAGGEEVRSTLLSRLGHSANSKKVKDALGPGQPKVNIYADADVFNRAKVDLDRDGKWDEKWTFKDGRIERKIAPADDENYTQTEQVGAAAPPSEPAPRPGPGDSATPVPGPEGSGSVRDVDAAMDQTLRRPVVPKIKDATKGRPFKINVYSDDGQRFNRAKVDLDRDEKWDEKWTFKSDGSTERKVAPADDENYSETFVRQGTSWREL